MEYRLTMKDLPRDLRPRERLGAVGVLALSNAELLAIVLGTGSQEETALELAQRLLSNPGGLRFLAETPLEEMIRFRGIGPAKGAQVKAAVELGRRIASTDPMSRPVIRCPEDVSNLLMEEMKFLDREHFRSISLNTKNQVLAVDTVSIGSLSASLVHPRELFKNAIKRSAAAVILIHNHPSGDPSPSAEDRAVTQRLMEAGKILGIEVLDHIIIGDSRYLSLKEQGMM